MLLIAYSFSLARDRPWLEPRNLLDCFHLRYDDFAVQHLALVLSVSILTWPCMVAYVASQTAFILANGSHKQPSRVATALGHGTSLDATDTNYDPQSQACGILMVSDVTTLDSHSRPYIAGSLSRNIRVCPPRQSFRPSLPTFVLAGQRNQTQRCRSTIRESAPAP
ncbi:hypothetical protein K431DRAFT_85534 [Polychaeton citri CBS 116435]|uniref:Uncharacterized protein n=1 Tax=Polychaeton citri CBS 116435 TaxID=1314669 RepID=A0A9P4Q6Z2_9PEZI|nr:hypothetical protein K431DRAFT_85534 [Polychaeton citri CBS 116435]